MYKILLLATLAVAALAGDSHTKRQVLLPNFVYPSIVGGLPVSPFASVGYTSYPYVTYQVSAPTIVAPAVATATVTTTTVAPVPVPADTIKVAAYPIAPAPVPVAVAAPVVVGCPGKSEAGVGCPGRNPSKGSHTKISVIQTDD